MSLDITFSPPDSCSMSRKRFVGGIAVNLMPCRKGSSGLSRLKYAVPPMECRLHKSRPPFTNLEPFINPLIALKASLCSALCAMACVALLTKVNKTSQSGSLSGSQRKHEQTHENMLYQYTLPTQIFDSQTLCFLQEKPGRVQSKPAACEVLEDGVNDSSNVLKSSREGVIALLAYCVKGPCRSLRLFPGCF